MCVCQRDKREEALRLAQLSAEKPHFSHCLEWLLFTVFDTEISRYFLIREGKLNESDFEHQYFFSVMSCKRSVSKIASFGLYIIGTCCELRCPSELTFSA
jgi:hypothetical protein